MIDLTGKVDRWQTSITLIGSDGLTSHSIGGCKEYILNAMWNTVNGKDGGIYSNSYRKLDLDKVVVLAGGLKGERRSTVRGANGRYVMLPYDFSLQAIDYLHQIETAFRLPHSKVEPSKDYPDKMVFTGDRAWLVSPPMLSLYGLIIRSGIYHEVGKPWTETMDGLMQTPSAASVQHDGPYYKRCRSAIHRIAQKGWRSVFGEDIKRNWNCDQESIHDYGICCYGEDAFKHQHPEWYE